MARRKPPPTGVEVWTPTMTYTKVIQRDGWFWCGHVIAHEEVRGSSVAFTSPAMHYGPGVGGNWHGFTFGAINRKLDRAVERLRREDKRYAERIEIPV